MACVVFLGGCASELDGPDIGGSTEALGIVTSDCSVRALGELDGGEFLLGSVRGDGVRVRGVWHHWTPPAEDGPGRSEDAVGHARAERSFFQGHADSLTCRINGATLAVIEGTGRLDGDDGYTFRVTVQEAEPDRYRITVQDANGNLAVSAIGVLDSGNIAIESAL